MIPRNLTGSLDIDTFETKNGSIFLSRLGLIGARWQWRALGVAFAAIVILRIVAPDIFIPDTSLGWVDAWYYVSLALKLPERVARYRFIYQSERIGWTLPAYVFNRVASPLIANYAVKTTFFVSAIVFLFGVVKETTGSVRTAVLVSSLAALHSFFVHTFGTSYVDGPMNAYILGNLYFSTLAFSRNGRSGSAFIAGMFWGAQALTHLVCLVLLPSVVVYCAFTWARRIDRRSAVFSILFELLGALAVLAGAWVVYAHWGIGTRPLQDSWAALFIPSTGWVRPSSAAWLRDAFWLVLPTAAAVWSLLAVGRAMVLGRNWNAMLRVSPVAWALLSVYASWLWLYFNDAPWLMLPFYSSYLMPFTFVALGRVAVTSVEMLSATMYSRLMVGLFGAGGISYWMSKFVNADVVLVFALACLVAATATRLRPRWHTSPVFPVLLVAGLLSVNCATPDYGPQLRNGYAKTAMAVFYRPATVDVATNVSRSERFEAAIASADRLAQRLSGNSGRRYFFWYDGDDVLGMFYRSVTSLMFAWSANDLLGEDFHGFDEQNYRTLATFSDTGMRDLVVLTRSPSVTPPDPRFTLEWTQAETVGGLSYFAHYLAFEPGPFAATPQ